MTVHGVDGLNAGYASALLEQYLENPDGVPDEWRVLFESGASELVATHPGLVRLLELLQEGGNGHAATAAPPPPPPPPPPPRPRHPLRRRPRPHQRPPPPQPRSRRLLRITRCSRRSQPRWRS